MVTTLVLVIRERERELVMERWLKRRQAVKPASSRSEEIAAELLSACRAWEARMMLLAGPGTELKGKLTEKMRYRPTAMIKPLMPAGASSLERLPST